MLPIAREFRLALRGLWRSPAFSLPVVLTLSVGIGFNVAIFSIVDAVLLRPLPYQDPERLVQIWGSAPEKNVPFHNVTYADVGDFRQMSRSFSIITSGNPASFSYLPASGTGDSLPEQVFAWRVDEEFFRTLGVRFLTGRDFTPEEDRPGATPVAVVSESFWRSRLGGDRNLSGKSIVLNERPHQVVGVLPPEFQFVGRRADVFVPLAAPRVRGPESTAISAAVFARLAPGVSLEAAQSEMDNVGARLREATPGTLGGNPRLWKVRDFVVRDIKPYVLLLYLGALLVLLIASANVANLLLVRANQHRRETALRSTLGAGRLLLVRQRLEESLLLAGAGGTGGLLLAWLLVRFCAVWAPEALPLVNGTAINLPVLGFSILLTTATGLLFGAVPAFVATRPQNLPATLRNGERGLAEGFARQPMRTALVVAEIALSVVLLAGAGLLLRSFQELDRQGPGFDADGVLTARVTPPPRYTLPERRNFYQTLLRRLEEKPQIEVAGLTTILPLTNTNTGTGLFVEGRPYPRPNEAPLIWVRIVNAGFFQAMRIPIRQGRNFTEEDRSDSQPVAIINETMAKRHWPGENPVGKRFATSIPQGRPPSWITIVGVAGDVRHAGIHRDPDAELFWPHMQPPIGPATIVVRGSASPEALVPVLRAEIAQLDRSIAPAFVRPMRQVVDDSLAMRRVSMWVTGVFAVVALLVAGIGVFAVVSYSVSRRRREMGVRLALGARGGDVVRMVISQTMRVAALGVLAGLGLAFAASKWLQSMLFAISPQDPVVFALAAATLLLVAALAAWTPANSAARTEPMDVLRSE